MSSSPLTHLSGSGVAVWLDDLSRPLLTGGGLADLVRESSVVGVTTNPTIFAGAISGSDAYDTDLHALAHEGADVEAAITRLTTDDVRAALDVLAPVHAATGGRDGRVSIEVDPRLAHDADGTVAQAAELAAIIDRPGLLVKIPATVEGIDAITRTIAAGISVNVTLIFSIERYLAVIDAYLTGLELARAAGHDLAGLRSVASFFVSRVDTAVDPLLDASDDPRAPGLRGTIALANARRAYQVHLETLASPRWAALAALGAHPQRPLWASTGVKDPSLPDTLYVDALVADGTVNTMPRATLDAVADHGSTSTNTTDTITPAIEDALDRLALLREVGIDLDAVTDTLEREGVAKFAASWDDLLATVATKISPTDASQEDAQ
ncbi:transaldolase [Sanguibacter sp. HDW7]|uniref:transaldolase n=1 Tax=Sanguibacter sp. HDW7 TaxID=2714931 RepID=UPI00140BA766|nr:transaldolase [Sanguibacter sp. HDW7]QIK83476.1 transaldolase [Sanguibacter sp. HDW7]